MLRNLNLVAIAVVLVGLTASAAMRNLWGQRLTFGTDGRLICSRASGSAVIYMDPAGIMQDSLGSNVSGYYPFGPTNLYNLTVEAIITPIKAYTGAPLGDYPSNTYSHGGVGIRHVTSSEFAGLVMLTAENTNGVAGAGQIHIVDRTNGVERASKWNLPVVSYGTRYKLRLVNTEVTNLAVSVWNYDAGSLLTNFNYVLTQGAATSGAPVFHVYGHKMLVNQCLVTEESGARTWFGPQLWSQFYTANDQQGYWLSNGVLRMFANGSSNSVNSWNLPISTVRMQSGTVRGKLKPISGRIHGVSITYSNGYGASLYWDDNGNGIRHATNVAAASPTVVTTYATGDLTFGTEYDWTLVKSNDVISWTIDGDTVTITNSTYPGADFFGLIGFGGISEHREIYFGP